MASPHGSYRRARGAWMATLGFLLGAALPAQVPTLLHSFSGTEGSGPNVSMVRGNDGFLYGITIMGGTNTCDGGQCGTIFRIDALGNFLSVYDFPESATDAFRPLDGLTLGADGFFYGTTLAGGELPPVFGTVYKFDASGDTLTVLHSFHISDGGWNPIGGVARSADGTLYGTTANGGGTSLHCNGCGTLFSLDSLGSLSILHSFSWDDGAIPQTTPVLGADGNLYGTASLGGLDEPVCTGGAAGCGTVFRMGLVAPNTGTFTTLHTFTGGADGWRPNSALIKASDGNLYGTTVAGGDLVACGIGCGTVYKIDSSGTFTTLHAFHFTDGRDVVTGLIQATDGDFYGTTEYGGANDLGTIYEMDAAGTVTTLYSFDGTVGQYPQAGLVQASDGNLYGTAYGGAALQGLIYRLEHQCFHDVATSSPFYPFICNIGVHQITGGCGGGNYCPASNVTRAQMAVFLLKAEHGSAYVPPPCAGMFTDVACPGGFAVDWIEELATEGITGGCGTGIYCPANPVTRAQMAAFLLKAEHGSGYTPPACAGVFSDVACPSLFADWIEQLYAESVTGGCATGPLRYCPSNDNTRGQMAVFLVKTFGLM